jgi:hypothetical protein
MATVLGCSTFMKVVVPRPPLPFLVLGIIFKIPMTKAGLMVDREQPPAIPKFGMKTAETNRSIPDIPIAATGTAGASPWLKRPRVVR